MGGDPGAEFGRGMLILAIATLRTLKRPRQQPIGDPRQKWKTTSNDRIQFRPIKAA
jgi:hypothetical protein